MLGADAVTPTVQAHTPDAAARALLVTSVFPEPAAVDRLGSEGYSYGFVCRAFAPLLGRLGEVVDVDRPESRLDYAVDRARRSGLEPLHLSFRPLQHTYLTSLAPNVAFPFWEFPDIPCEDLDANPRHNWRRIADQLDAILCASEFTRDAFVRAGVRTPVHVVPVPVRADYFALLPFRPGSSGRLDTPVHLLSRNSHASAKLAPWMTQRRPRDTLASRAHIVLQRMQSALQRTLRATLPMWLDRQVGLLGQAARTQLRAIRDEIMVRSLPNASLDLSGIVYTSFVNPFDERKNWRDLVSAFLLALQPYEDAILVLKLVVPGPLRAEGLRRVLGYYDGLGIAHRCQLAIAPSFLSDSEMLQLTRLSTYYITAARAEGACLPAQDFLAAGRPVIGPSHTAMTEYVTPDTAFVVDSHPEPTWFPHDSAKRIRTTWQRLVWQSLHDQVRASYHVAKQDPERYAHMAQRGRERMQHFAGAAPVWLRLQAALTGVTHGRAAVR